MLEASAFQALQVWAPYRGRNKPPVELVVHDLDSDSDYGLASSGLLVTAGNEWVEGMDDTDNGVRFNYTLAAKKMAYIFFGVECAMKPSNKGITILVAASNEEVEEQLNELFKQ